MSAENDDESILTRVRSAGRKKLLFLSHAVTQMRASIE